MSVWAVIPSAGRDTLHGAIGSLGIPGDQVVVVATAPGVSVRDVNVIQDRGPVNIHRWWNRGITFAEQAGAKYVAVVNDDVLAEPGALAAMADELERSGADVCWTGESGISGHCFMLPAGGLRPDEGYRWWFGDTDLDRRAAERFGTCRAGQVEHLHPNELTERSPGLLALAQVDRERFDARWRVTL